MKFFSHQLYNINTVLSRPMTSGVDCQSDNCTITNCWACYYSYNKLPFPQLPPSCPHECENPLDEICMKNWGRCVQESFLNVYNMVCSKWYYIDNGVYNMICIILIMVSTI